MIKLQDMGVTQRKTFTYAIFKMPAGYMAAIRTYKGLYSIILPKKTPSELIETVKKTFKKIRKYSASFGGLKKKLKRYFAKKRVRFNYRLDLEGFSDFDKKVFAVTATIPRGQTRSYSWVARLIGDTNFSRAVGQALSRNRLPVVIPCHRVVGKKDFGGFSYGMDNKRLLLNAEGRLW
ncbi:MAG: methylated-DNA--[protein]-cysteine S-methyltransferase [Candidatus Saganbacteria bacterium]|nr:methylated-DNA--[protein]-cysteine S-methyltransferase [Candidatus Saganbacteria bacterium]